MDKNEVIILSSDDESDFHQFKKYMPYVTIKPISKKKDNILKTSSVDDKTTPRNGVTRKVDGSPADKVTINNKVPKIKCKNVSNESPEIVDLEDCLDKSPNVFIPTQEDCGSNGESEQVQSNFKLDIIDIDVAEDDSKKCSLDKNHSDIGRDKGKSLQYSDSVDIESNQENATCKATSSVVKLEMSQKMMAKENQMAVNDDMTDKDSNKSLKSFAEFVEFCGSLEPIMKDRIRLMKKLMKYYGEANSSYIGCQEFTDLIQKCREKVNRHNLYLIAKDVTAELRFRKRIEVTSVALNTAYEKNQRISGDPEKVEVVQEKCNRQIKKRTKFIKKIFKKLNKLGSKIRELEDEEVDLSDEEGSSYIQLQRYRERFCQIYKKLCKYTNEIPDADSLCNRKICFTESKYPTINKCIELWLNKIKRFPDFTDIMKLLESQSSSLGLPSNRESLRVIAIEIFQQVGAMLQRRRKYELWDSFCGFLNDQIDPASTDSVLEKILKDNFETRIKKEQEIFQHYSELQEREQLEPEEVPEEEANRSPVESGNEDEKEIEEIENSINRRLDVTITEDTKEEGSSAKYSEGDESKNDSVDETELKPGSTTQRESKNNYKNCKSLKWRSENSGKLKNENVISEDSSTGPEHEKEKPLSVDGVAEEDSPASNDDHTKSKESNKNDSDLELLAVEVDGDASSEKEVQGRTQGKRAKGSESKSPFAKRKCVRNWKSEANSLGCFHVDDENENCIGKSNESFDVHYCQVFPNNVFENLSERKKDGEKRKVFRDLTNVNRLMEMHGKRRNFSGLFAPSFFHRSFREFEKSSWKRRFKVSFRMPGPRGEKCALSQEKSGKSVNSDAGGESDEKDIQNNSDGGGDERNSYFSGHGGESHEDGDEDRNRKNGRTGDDINETLPEEEEDDEDDKDENETESKNESSEHSQPNKKTEEPKETNVETWPSKAIKSSDKTVDSLALNNTLKKGSEKGEEAHIKTVEEKEILELENIKQTVRSEARKFPKDKGEVKQSENQDSTKQMLGENSREKKSNLVDKENSETGKLSIVGNIMPGRFSQDAMEVEIAVSRIAQGTDRYNIVNSKKENGSTVTKRRKQENDTGRVGTTRKSFQVQYPSGKVNRKSPASTSDEERVKRFLLHSPSSISITPPRKLTLSKPSSQAAMQALATLRNLKGISATIVRGKPKSEDDVMVVGNSCKRYADQRYQNQTKRSRTDLPVISSVQSIYCSTPKIVTVQGNVSGFDNCSPEVTSSEKSECDSSTIRISNVWGSLPNNFMQSMQDNEPMMPGCSSQNSQQSNFQPWNVVKKKNTKKKVEYVVLE